MKTKLQNSKSKTPNTQKGITLVALVITIIVLLILAGVAFNMAINSDGLFTKGNDAADKWNAAVVEEETIISNLLEIATGITTETIIVSEDSETPTLASALAKLDEITKEEVIIYVEKDSVEWETGSGWNENPFISSTNTTTKKLVIEGATKDVEFIATGAGLSYIKADNGATLVFKNLTIKDESVLPEDAVPGWENYSLEFSGKLKFENCDFDTTILLTSGNDVELLGDFVNCSFASNVSGKYAAWVQDGSVTFTNCEFGPGTRGLKTHEQYGTDVKKLLIDNCTFKDISEKPGIAIGTLNSDTELIIKNSEFRNCQAGDQSLYIYETDTDVTTFDFTLTDNNVVNDT